MGGTFATAIGEDGTYTVNAIFYETLPALKGQGIGIAVLSGGNTATVYVSP
jgi:hypothetical protein